MAPKRLKNTAVKDQQRQLMKVSWDLTGTYICEMRSPLVVSAREELLALSVTTSVGTETPQTELTDSKEPTVMHLAAQGIPSFSFSEVGSLCRDVRRTSPCGNCWEQFPYEAMPTVTQRVHKEEKKNTTPSVTVWGAKRRASRLCLQRWPCESNEDHLNEGLISGHVLLKWVE